VHVLITKSVRKLMALVVEIRLENPTTEGTGTRPLSKPQLKIVNPSNKIPA
jgi:hypothetical protein